MSLGSFLAGVAVGGGLVYGSLSYHVLRTEDGVAFVPKLQPSFDDVYLDVRQFGITDWTRHRTMAAAIVSAHKEHIFTQHASETVSQGLGGFLQEWNRLKQGSGP